MSVSISTTAQHTISCKPLLLNRSIFRNLHLFGSPQYPNLCKSSFLPYSSRIFLNKTKALPNSDFEFIWEKDPTPLLDTIDSPLHLKNLSTKELKQLANEIRSEISFFMSKSRTEFKTSLASVELTVAIHFVFNAPMDKILWDFGEQAYAHKILTGRRHKFITLGEKDGISKFTSRFESEFDAFISGHGSNSVSAGLGMAVARDINGRKNKVVTIMSSWSTMSGQVYEAMSNAGFLDSNMILILNDTYNSLNPNFSRETEQKSTKINAISTFLSKIQSSKSFRKFREDLKGLMKRIGKGIYEIAAKFDQYARGMVGPRGATLFEELGLYYIGPIDGHNIDDLICVLSEVSSLDTTGPVLLHVITNINKESTNSNKDSKSEKKETKGGVNYAQSKTYNDVFMECLLAEAERDPAIVLVTAGLGVDRSTGIFRERFPDRFFDVGKAEQHAVTFAAGLCCGDLKPFCLISSCFLQNAFHQVIQDVDMQRLPVTFVITHAGLAGSDAPIRSGSFDIAYMSCLPNMIVMAPSDSDEIARMVATALATKDRPTCFRFPRSVVVPTNRNLYPASPFEIGKGEILVKGDEVALLGYGAMMENCIRAHCLLDRLGVRVTIANARFCKPLDIDLIRDLCAEHEFIITVEEGSIGGFGSHVSQFMSLDGFFDHGKVKWRPIVVPDRYVEHGSLGDQFDVAGVTGHHIAATTLRLLGRHREALQLMT